MVQYLRRRRIATAMIGTIHQIFNKRFIFRISTHLLQQIQLLFNRYTQNYTEQLANGQSNFSKVFLPQNL
jgi:hypothetical protein